jgi:hypothetical protein
VYGPVARPPDIIDPDETGLPEGGGMMDCAQLRVSRRVDPLIKNGPIELLGKGNVKLEGRDFFAQADEVAYDESKGLYTLRSHGNHKATITRQDKVGGKPIEQPGQRIEFIPAKKWINIDGATGGGGDL